MRISPAVLAFILAPALLAGCRESLYSGMSEADANEMVYVLLNRGVDARKENAGKAGFFVTVDGENLIRSLEIIKEHSLPRTKFQSLGTVFSGQGMISSQLEEQSRLAFALSQELSSTFSRIDGVLDARVHVVLMHNEQGTGLTTPPSASVFIRHTKDSPVPDMVGGIRETTARAVPGLSIEKVSVVLESFQENIVAARPRESAASETPSLAVAAGLSALTAAAVTALCFLLAGYLRRKKGGAAAAGS